MIVIHTPEGRIIQTLEGYIAPELLAHLDEQGRLYADVDFELNDNHHVLFDQHYVSEGKLVPKPVSEVVMSKVTIAADGSDAAEITGLPSPCTLRINGQLIEVPGGSLTVRSRHPATFVATLDHWPFMPWSATVEAV